MYAYPEMKQTQMRERIAETQADDQRSKKACQGGTILTFLFLVVGIVGALYMTMSGDSEPTQPPKRATRSTKSRFKQPDPITPTKPDAKVLETKPNVTPQKLKPKVQSYPKKAKVSLKKPIQVVSASEEAPPSSEEGSPRRAGKVSKAPSKAKTSKKASEEGAGKTSKAPSKVRTPKKASEESKSTRQPPPKVLTRDAILNEFQKEDPNDTWENCTYHFLVRKKKTLVHSPLSIYKCPIKDECTQYAIHLQEERNSHKYSN